MTASELGVKRWPEAIHVSCRVWTASTGDCVLRLVMVIEHSGQDNVTVRQPFLFEILVTFILLYHALRVELQLVDGPVHSEQTEHVLAARIGYANVDEVQYRNDRSQKR